MLTRSIPTSERTQRAGLVGSAVRWFLALSALYVVYASSSFLSLAGDLRVADRLSMMLASTAMALSLLVAPATFAASARSPILFGERQLRLVRRSWAHLVLLGLGAYALGAFGPLFSSFFLPPERFPPPEVVPASRHALESARVLVPSTIASFAILSGIAGGLIGRVTGSLSPRGRATMIWLCWLVLFLSFWPPFLLSTSMVMNLGVSPQWILPGSLLLPSLLIAATGLYEFGRLRTKSASIDSHRLDRVDRVVNPQAVGEDESYVGVPDATQTELEMIHVAQGIRQSIGPDANLSTQRLDEIVTVLLDAPGCESANPAFARRATYRTDRVASVGEFCTVCACIASGVLMVGMLGGAPPNLALALLVGLLASGGILMATQRLSRPVRKVLT